MLMPAEHSEAARRYCAAFPPLRGAELALHWHAPPAPAWPILRQVQQQQKERKPRKPARERRNSGAGPRRSSRRRELPEWASAPGAGDWAMGAADPLRAPEPEPAHAVPGWQDEDMAAGSAWPNRQDRPRSPTEEEMYAQFEAKFDRSIEAIWHTPDDCQELPIDLHALLSSPSDFLGPPLMDIDLPERLRPLNLTDAPEVSQIFAPIARENPSLAAINHSRELSGFAEVPRRRGLPPPPGPPMPIARPLAIAPRSCSDLLTSDRTHFKPIARDASPYDGYADGAAFDIRCTLPSVEFTRSPAGGQYLGARRYLELREPGIRYELLNLTPAQRCEALEDDTFRLRFAVKQVDVAAQTDVTPPSPPATPLPLSPGAPWSACAECGGAAKKMRPSGIASIWSEEGRCSVCAAPTPEPLPPLCQPPPDELSREWEELLADISAAHAEYAHAAFRQEVLEEALVSAERKRRHSASRRTPAPAAAPAAARALAACPRCAHPHARFLHGCALALAMDRPLTR